MFPYLRPMSCGGQRQWQAYRGLIPDGHWKFNHFLCVLSVHLVLISCDVRIYRRWLTVERCLGKSPTQLKFPSWNTCSSSKEKPSIQKMETMNFIVCCTGQLNWPNSDTTLLTFISQLTSLNRYVHYLCSSFKWNCYEFTAEYYRYIIYRAAMLWPIGFCQSRSRNNT